MVQFQFLLYNMFARVADQSKDKKGINFDICLSIAFADAGLTVNKSFHRALDVGVLPVCAKKSGKAVLK